MAHACHTSDCLATNNAPEHCPLCGGANDCRLCTAAAYKGSCWCVAEGIPDELIARVPVEARNKACICRKCVMGFHHVKENGIGGPKIRPGDIYFDNGLMVFTAAYHQRRGYCCGNDCRHCPFQPQPAIA